MKSLLLVCVLLSMGCALGSGSNSSKGSSWVGAHLDDVIYVLGEPNRKTEREDWIEIVYEKSSAVTFSRTFTIDRNTQRVIEYDDTR